MAVDWRSPPAEEWDGVLRPRRCFICGVACENTGPICPEHQQAAIANMERHQRRFRMTPPPCPACGQLATWEPLSDTDELIGAWRFDCGCLLPGERL